MSGSGAISMRWSGAVERMQLGGALAQLPPLFQQVAGGPAVDGLRGAFGTNARRGIGVGDPECTGGVEHRSIAGRTRLAGKNCSDQASAFFGRLNRERFSRSGSQAEIGWRPRGGAAHLWSNFDGFRG